MATQGMQGVEEQRTAGYRVAGILIGPLLRIIIIVLLSLGLCVIVFAGETDQYSGDCDLNSGSYATLGLSREQCSKMGQMSDRFRNDTAEARAEIAEKHLELRKLAEDPTTDPYTVNKIERELSRLEQEVVEKARQGRSSEKLGQRI